MQTQLPLLLLWAVLPLLIYLLLRRLHGSRGHHNLPPSPWKLPFIGNFHQLGPLVHQSLHKLSKTHGQVMLLHLGTTPALVVSSPAAVKDALKTHDLIFANRPSMAAADHLFYHYQDVVFGPYGEYWRHMKKVATTHLLSNKMVQSFGDVREEETAAMVDKVRKSCQVGPVNLTEILLSLANAVMCRVTLGKRCSIEGSGRRKDLCEATDEMLALLGELHAEDYFGWIGSLWSILNGTRSRFRRCKKKIDGVLERALQDHRAERSGENGDFVDVLLSLNEDSSGGLSLSEDNIKGLILDMLAGGTDPSFITLEWTMAELIKNPQVLSKAQKEVQEFVAFPISESSIAELKYMDAVIKEALRLHPPAPLMLPRESISETQVQGFTIPSGTRLLVNLWSMGRDPNNWEDPERFMPERFLGSDIDYKGRDFQYLPFGSGRRICPGLAFGIYFIKMTLYNLLRHFDWEVCADLDMEEVFGLGTTRKNPLVVAARPR